MNAADLCQQCIHILECPWNKSEEALGVFRLAALHFSYFYQMFKTFLNGFYMTKHHGGGSRNIYFMCFVHDVKPFLRTAFSFADQSSNPVNQDFCTGAGQGIHTGFL